MKRRNNGPTGMEALNSISEGLGQVFEGLKEALEKAENGEAGTFEKTSSFGKEGSPLSGMAGIRTKVGIAGQTKSSHESHDNDDVVARSKVKTGKSKPADNKPSSMNRTPLVDVIEEEGRFLVIAELPGIAENEIDTQIKDEMLIINTTGERRFSHSVSLPSHIDPSAVSSKLRNGILEITILKKPLRKT